MAAHQFLERNDLSQMFLDQVVDFILKNTKGVTIGQQSSSASDPFTGELQGSRKQRKPRFWCDLSPNCFHKFLDISKTHPSLFEK